MGEQPIFTAKAHVFQIDPETRKKWLPLSTQAVNVSFYFDSARSMYRIISLENQQPIVNSTIVPKMNFSKTSQKFGQWADSGAGTVYGLGFSSEAELVKFSDKFAEIKEIVKTMTGAPPPPIQTSTPPVQRPEIIQQTPPIVKPTTQPTVTKTTNGHGSESSWAVEKLQLQQEKEKLEKALNESKRNADRWMEELTSLRSENDELKAVMIENSKNVEEWKKRLNAYEEERINLSRRITELERNDQSSVLQKQVSDAMSKLQISEHNMQQKQDEVMELKRKLDEMKTLDVQTQRLNAKLQAVEEEKLKLRGEVQQLQLQLEQLQSHSSSGREQLQAMQQQISSKINDLYEMNDKLAEIIHAVM